MKIPQPGAWASDEDVSTDPQATLRTLLHYGLLKLAARLPLAQLDPRDQLPACVEVAAQLSEKSKVDPELRARLRTLATVARGALPVDIAPSYSSGSWPPEVVLDREALGDLVRARRLVHGLTQEDLSHALAVSSKTVYRIEKGDGGSLETLWRLIVWLGVDPARITRRR